jgi:hypothetical protein
MQILTDPIVLILLAVSLGLFLAVIYYQDNEALRNRKDGDRK